jgi:hypothetical protein
VKTVQDPDRPSVAVGAQMAETLASSRRQRLSHLVRPLVGLERAMVRLVERWAPC